MTVEPEDVEVWTPIVPFMVVACQEPWYTSLELASSICRSVLPLLGRTDMIMYPAGPNVMDDKARQKVKSQRGTAAMTILTFQASHRDREQTRRLVSMCYVGSH